MRDLAYLFGGLAGCVIEAGCKKWYSEKTVTGVVLLLTRMGRQAMRRHIQFEHPLIDAEIRWRLPGMFVSQLLLNGAAGSEPPVLGDILFHGEQNRISPDNGFYDVIKFAVDTQFAIVAAGSTKTGLA